MTKNEKQRIANLIYEIETNNDNNISEKEEKIGELIKYCSMMDLLEIDEIVMEKLMKQKDN